jgi:hypothetical protein
MIVGIIGAISAGVSLYKAIKGNGAQNVNGNDAQNVNGNDAQNVSNAMLNFRRKDAETNMRHQLELAKIARVEDIVVSTAKSIQNNA